MLFSLILVSLLSSHVLATEEKKTNHWAVLVAGSNGWGNYRHQADVCHAYQLLLKDGIPPGNIITMMYDDVAHHQSNPFPGQLYNDYKHNDVYRGVKVDYHGTDVTPVMFRRVLLGDPELKKAGKKVLESGPGDNVFIFFSDHGAPNLIGFPRGELYARQLQDIFTSMNKEKRYNSLVMYVEACFAGSMFENLLPTNMRIFVTTASNAHESSWASFCNDPKIHTCLADAYSYTWMSDSEHHDLKSWTLSNQFHSVKSHVQSSHVMEYGDMKLSNAAVAAFQAGDRRSLPNKKQNTAKLEVLDSRPAVQAHLVPLMHRIKLAVTQDKVERANRHLHRALELSKMAQETMDEIVHDVTQQITTPIARSDVDSHLDCYETAFENYKTKCFSIQQVPEVARELRKLDQLCKRGYEVEKIVQAIFDVCG